MPSRLPPLGTLRAFRAAAHCLSFTIAAEELNVTQAAISHQVKALEDFLQRSLFVRGNRRLTLSEAGKQFLPYVDQMFSLLEQGTAHVTARSNDLSLTVSLLPSFASRWLVPRLGLFLKANPEIDFRLAPSRTLTNYQMEGIDLGIRYGSGKYPGMTCIHLMDEDIFPVCSPLLMNGKYPLRKPEDLCHHVLLHDDGHGDWHKWLVAAGANNVDPGKGPVYSDSAMAVQSALEGDGVALARSQLVRDDIHRGQLVKPFDISQPSSFSYYIAYLEEQPVTTAMQAFIDWIQQQVAGDQRKYESVKSKAAS